MRSNWGDPPCPQGSSECHNMGGWRLWGNSGGCLQPVRNHDPWVTFYMHTTFPWGASSLKTCPALVQWRPSLSVCGFKCWGPPNHLFSISGKPTPCFCIIPLNLSIPPISQFFPWHNQELSEPSSNHINLTWKHASWPAFSPRCLFFFPVIPLRARLRFPGIIIDMLVGDRYWKDTWGWDGTLCGNTAGDGGVGGVWPDMSGWRKTALVSLSFCRVLWLSCLAQYNFWKALLQSIQFWSSSLVAAHSDDVTDSSETIF